MRRPLLVILLLLSAVTTSGCGLFGVGCLSQQAHDASVFAPLPFVCLFFSGDCCTDKDEKGNIGCGDLFDPFFYPCGQAAHGGCHCFDITKDGSQRQSRASAAYGIPTIDYAVGLPFTGMRTAHRLSFDAAPQSLQTFAGAVTYSPGFVFNGFTALGPAGTTIGGYGFDFDGNGSADATLPVRALDADHAYVDINLDGQATLVDPTIEHDADVPAPGARTFVLALPAGGDMAPKLARVPSQATTLKIHVTLAAGILDNPPNPGAYGVTGTFTSVDPDTGDASNGTGQSPQSVSVPTVGIMIDPSPLELLDHFLCYKTKPSKGNVCGAAASANVGALCTTDADCGGGPVGACAKNKFPKGVQTTLADRYTSFAPRAADVAKPVKLCTPVDQNGEGRHDTTTHLRGFQIKDAKGTTKRAASVPLRIVNQLGTVAVQVKGPDTLLEPASKQLGSVAPTLGPNVVDRYACYKTKLVTKRCSGDPSRACKTDAACGADGPCLGKFPKGLQVTLTDQFATGKRFDVVKPTRLCTPALANGDPIASPDGQLLCYKVKPAAGVAKHGPVVGAIHTTSALGRERLDTVVEDEVCVPSLELTTS